MTTNCILSSVYMVFVGDFSDINKLVVDQNYLQPPPRRNILTTDDFSFITTIFCSYGYSYEVVIIDFFSNQCLFCDTISRCIIEQEMVEFNQIPFSSIILNHILLFDLLFNDCHCWNNRLRSYAALYRAGLTPVYSVTKVKSRVRNYVMLSVRPLAWCLHLKMMLLYLSCKIDFL